MVDLIFNTKIGVYLEFLIMEEFRLVFKTEFFPNKPKGQLWIEIGEAIGVADITKKRWFTMDKRWAKSAEDKQNNIPLAPDMDYLFKYTVCKKLSSITYPAGKEIANRAIAITLTRIATESEGQKKAELSHEDVELLRFYALNRYLMQEARSENDIFRAFDLKLNKELSHFMKQNSTESLLKKMRALDFEWGDYWDHLKEIMYKHKWLYNA